MIDKIQASGIHVLVVRDETETERGGLLLPASAQKKPHSGKIISVGTLVQDKTIKKGKTAVFNQNVGFILNLHDTEVTVLNEQQIIGTE
jgi:co-chaperonin GroES (HSP10)